MLHRFQGKTFGGPIIQEDGAVYTPKGVQVHVLGAENPKEITKGTVIAVVAILMAIIILATFLAGKQPKDFPYELELRNSIGQPLETVTMKAGVAFSDIVEKEPGVYYANCGFPIDGVAFDLYFYEEDGKLSGFAYIADYQAEPKEAAKDIYNALINLGIETFIPTGQTESVSVTRRNLRKELNNESVFLVKQTSDITPVDSRDPQKAFIDSLEAAEDWEGRVGEYVTRKATLYLDKGASYEPETQKVQLVLSFRIEPQREEKYGG